MSKPLGHDAPRNAYHSHDEQLPLHASVYLQGNTATLLTSFRPSLTLIKITTFILNYRHFRCVAVKAKKIKERGKGVRRHTSPINLPHDVSASLINAITSG